MGDIDFKQIKNYISKDEIIKKEIYADNEYCIFTDRKIYRGSINADNKINYLLMSCQHLKTLITKTL